MHSHRKQGGIVNGATSESESASNPASNEANSKELAEDFFVVVLDLRFRVVHVALFTQFLFITAMVEPI